MLIEIPYRWRLLHTKHSDTRKEFARDAFNEGTIGLVLFSTAEQLADG